MKKAFTRMVQKLSLKAYEKDIKREAFDNSLYGIGILFVAIIVLAVLGHMHGLIAFFLMFCIGMMVNLMQLIQLYMNRDKNPWIALDDAKKEMQPYKYSTVAQQLEHMYIKGQITETEVFEKVSVLHDILMKELILFQMEKDTFPNFGSPEVAKTKKELMETIESIYRSLISWCMTRSA